jgi:hypothetical protein
MNTFFSPIALKKLSSWHIWLYGLYGHQLSLSIFAEVAHGMYYGSWQNNHKQQNQFGVFKASPLMIT